VRSLPFLLSMLFLSCAQAQLECQPDFQVIPSRFGASFTITDAFNRTVNFAYTATFTSATNQVDDTNNVAVLTPSSGATPGVVYVGLNPVPAALFEPGGTYVSWVTFTSLGQTPATTTSCYIHFAKPAEPVPTIQPKNGS
jgi:hypothetical protein